MDDHPDKLGELINLLLISRHLERLADHATNIAEEVIYLIEGEILDMPPIIANGQSKKKQELVDNSYINVYIQSLWKKRNNNGYAEFAERLKAAAWGRGCVGRPVWSETTTMYI